MEEGATTTADKSNPDQGCVVVSWAERARRAQRGKLKDKDGKSELMQESKKGREKRNKVLLVRASRSFGPVQDCVRPDMQRRLESACERILVSDSDLEGPFRQQIEHFHLSESVSAPLRYSPFFFREKRWQHAGFPRRSVAAGLLRTTRLPTTCPHQHQEFVENPSRQIPMRQC